MSEFVITDSYRSSQRVSRQTEHTARPYSADYSVINQLFKGYTARDQIHDKDEEAAAEMKSGSVTKYVKILRWF